MAEKGEMLTVHQATLFEIAFEDRGGDATGGDIAGELAVLLVIGESFFQDGFGAIGPVDRDQSRSRSCRHSAKPASRPASSRASRHLRGRKRSKSHESSRYDEEEGAEEQERVSGGWGGCLPLRVASSMSVHDRPAAAGLDDASMMAASI